MAEGAVPVRAKWTPGAVSATFKKIPLTAEEIIRLLRECGLEAVEWSENLHVFPGEPGQAAELGNHTRDAGLRVAAYGSYYRLGAQADPEEAFLSSLASAAALGAPLIRVWAGGKSSLETGEAEWDALTREAALLGRLAGERGIRVAFEWHKNTLTDTNEGAERLLRQAGQENLYCLWQPTVALSPWERTAGIRRLGDRLLNFHVYSWPDGTRGALNGAEWAYYLEAAGDAPRCLLLEFVRGDTVEQFRSDAACLLNLIGGRA